MTRSMSARPAHERLLDDARERFDAAEDLTVSVEEEFALLDPESLDLVNRFEDVQAAVRPEAPLVDGGVQRVEHRDLDRAGRMAPALALIAPRHRVLVVVERHGNRAAVRRRDDRIDVPGQQRGIQASRAHQPNTISQSKSSAMGRRARILKRARHG